MAERSHALELLARAGYGARGIVNLVVGGLAVLAAVGAGGGTTDSDGALATLLAQPFGAVLLGAVAIGLAGFALWRFLQAVLDADGRGHDAKALAVRASQFVSGVIYVGLTVTAAGLAVGAASASSGGDGARDWTATVMGQPFGVFLVGFAGLCVIAAGATMAVKAYKASFMRMLSCDASWVRTLGRAGYAARALVFLIAGVFVVLAALHANPDEARGLSGALDTLRGQPFGAILFGLTAAGLAAFGAFGLVEARYRHIAAPDVSEAGETIRSALPG